MIERAAFISDLHVPEHDERAFERALAVVRDLRPHHVFVMGDLGDFPQASRYRVEPARVAQLQSDLDQMSGALNDIRKAARKASIHWVEGNHDARLRKFLTAHAPALRALRSLSMEELLRLESFRVTYHRSGWVRYSGELVKHGTRVRVRAGTSAHAEMDEAGTGGVSAHTHRLGLVYRRTRAGVASWAESGCLCQLDPEYAEGGVMDWQHGIVLGEADGTRITKEIVEL